MNHRILVRGAAPLVLGAVAAVAASKGCSDDASSVVAEQIQSRSDLIGGPGALGEVGDFLIANEQVRFIIQGEGYSRGFGIYGGSLIDADLTRPESFGDSSGGKGRDNFSELFPALFLKAMRPSSIEIVRADDGSASIVVRGSAADFVFLAKRINDTLLTADDLIFRNVYTLRPGKRYLEITTTVTNGGQDEVELPSPGITDLLGSGAEFIFPVGDVILFGEGNQLFSEGAGFDMRFTLEKLYRQPVALPQLPGLVTPFLATRGDGISYGFMSGVTDPEASMVARARYAGREASDMVVPFVASAFTGAFYGAAPAVLQPGESFEFKKYFMVGNGDVASIRDVAQEIRATPALPYGGVVRERFTQAPEVEVSVMTFDARGRPFNQHTTDVNGQFIGNYPPGEYSYRVVAPGRSPTDPVPFTVSAESKTFLEIELDSPGFVAIRIMGEDGLAMPGKCSLIGVYPAANGARPAWEFLYELAIGEPVRPVDLIPDTEDPATRRYVEAQLITATGQDTQKVRPGRYRAVCSRGIEYDLYEQDIEVVARATSTVDALLRRAIDTTGWVSGDFHLHAVNSVDSFMALEDRVEHVAAEGVEIACSSDHNFVTDYTRAISSQGLERWVQGMVGLEMTTLEVGHFNGFPLRYDPGPITKGAFEWSGREPQELFADIRALGAYGPENTVVQVNHPRDTILGYFNDYNFNPDTGEPEESQNVLLSPEGPEFGPDKFSYDFDAIELFNGKRFDLMRHYRVPEELPPPPLPDVIPPAGTILRDENGRVAFPGGIDDWFTLLNSGRVYTAMGNSDTHGLEDEPGSPRSYMPVGVEVPGGIDELEVVAAIKNGKVLPTNGPFVKVSITGDGRCLDRKSNEPLGHERCEMGEVVVPREGKLTVDVDIQTAPWVPIDRVSFIVGGETVATVAGDRESLQKVTRELSVSSDTFVIVEVAGEGSLFPVYVPRELPSLQVSDALGSIASAFGFSLSPFGNLFPSQVTLAKPYAFTNPIFVDADGQGWVAPGVQRQALLAEQAPRVRGKRSQFQALPAIVKIFAAFGGHSHGH